MQKACVRTKEQMNGEPVKRRPASVTRDMQMGTPRGTTHTPTGVAEGGRSGDTSVDNVREQLAPPLWLAERWAVWPHATVPTEAQSHTRPGLQAGGEDRCAKQVAACFLTKRNPASPGSWRLPREGRAHVSNAGVRALRARWAPAPPRAAIAAGPRSRWHLQCFCTRGVWNTVSLRHQAFPELGCAARNKAEQTRPRVTDVRPPFLGRVGHGVGSAARFPAGGCGRPCGGV